MYSLHFHLEVFHQKSWNNRFQCGCSGAHSSMMLIILRQSKFFGCFSGRRFCVNIGWPSSSSFALLLLTAEWKRRLKILNFRRTFKGLHRLHYLQLHWISSFQSFVFDPRNNFFRSASFFPICFTVAVIPLSFSVFSIEVNVFALYPCYNSSCALYCKNFHAQPMLLLKRLSHHQSMDRLLHFLV